MIFFQKCEQLAANHLTRSNFLILERNFRYGKKEIDIIAQKNTLLIFVEVKGRRSLDTGYPCEAVGFYKQQNIMETAWFYLQNHPTKKEHDLRFDIIEILFHRNRFLLRHMPNAFEGCI